MVEFVQIKFPIKYLYSELDSIVNISFYPLVVAIKNKTVKIIDINNKRLYNLYYLRYRVSSEFIKMTLWSYI